MSSAVTLRWSLEGFHCELRMRDGAGELCLFEGGVIIARALVPSADAAYRWASERVQALTASRTDADRTKTG
jgi:hypothetical protein